LKTVLEEYIYINSYINTYIKSDLYIYIFNIDV
jgi:hypothetical protein